MRVLVCVKRVPAPGAKINIAGDGLAVDEDQRVQVHRGHVGVGGQVTQGAKDVGQGVAVHGRLAAEFSE